MAIALYEYRLSDPKFTNRDYRPLILTADCRKPFRTPNRTTYKLESQLEATALAVGMTSNGLPLRHEGAFPTLADDELAIRPAGWPAAGDVALSLEPPGLELPLWALWAVGARPPAVDRLCAELGLRRS